MADISDDIFIIFVMKNVFYSNYRQIFSQLPHEKQSTIDLGNGLHRASN